MWKCDTCGEEHEDQFSACWKCSANEPIPDNDDLPLKSLEKIFEREPPLTERLAESFTCPKCSSRGARAKRINVYGTILEFENDTCISLSCWKCSFTEFYNFDLLRDSSVSGTLLDIFNK